MDVWTFLLGEIPFLAVGALIGWIGITIGYRRGRKDERAKGVMRVKEQIERMIRQLFADTSKPVEVTKGELLDLRDVIDELVDTLNA